MAQPNEVVDLVVALFLTPIIISGTRAFKPKVRMFVAAFLGCLLVALTATILEGFVAYRLFNSVEHLMYAVAGIFAACGALQVWRRGGAWAR